MKMIEGFEYYIDTAGVIYKETEDSYREIKQKTPNYWLFKDGKKHCFNKCELITKTYLGEKPEGSYILVKDGNTKNINLDNLAYVRLEDVGEKIKGFENYLISTAGEVYIIKKDKIIKQQLLNTKRGYKQVKLRKNNKVYSYLVHRLVAQTYLPDVDDKMDVIHLTGDKKNNSIDNLSWCTKKDGVASVSFHEKTLNNNIICSLFVGNKFIDNFKSISECCRYAKNNFGCSYSSLRRYKISGKYQIKEPQMI